MPYIQIIKKKHTLICVHFNIYHSLPFCWFLNFFINYSLKKVSELKRRRLQRNNDAILSSFAIMMQRPSNAFRPNHFETLLFHIMINYKVTFLRLLYKTTIVHLFANNDIISKMIIYDANVVYVTN